MWNRSEHIPHSARALPADPLLPEVRDHILHARRHDGVWAGAGRAELGVGADAGEAAREVGHFCKEAEHGGAQDACGRGAWTRGAGAASRAEVG